MSSFACNIHTISSCNSLHFSIEDVTKIATLLILILKLIAKLRECIRYFRRGGWQQDGGDGTTNNKMGNESDNSIVASVEASTSAGNGVHHAYSTPYYYLERPCCFFFFFKGLVQVFFERDTSFSWGRYTILVDVVLLGPYAVR